MQRYDQFTFVGKRDPTQFSTATPKPLEDEPGENVFENNLQADDDDSVRVTRVTRDGHEYSAVFSAAELSNMYGDHPARPPVTGSGRELKILGPDTRSRIRNTQVFPYSAIAEIDYSDKGNGKFVSRLLCDRNPIGPSPEVV